MLVLTVQSLGHFKYFPFPVDKSWCGFIRTFVCFIFQSEFIMTNWEYPEAHAQKLNTVTKCSNVTHINPTSTAA